MNEIFVTDLMTKEVITVTQDTTMREVVKTLRAKSLSCLVIVDGQKPIGIITERDMVSILADLFEDDTWADLPIEEFMTSPIPSVSDGVTLIEAVDISRANSIRHIPVVDDEGHLVGLLTQTDIINGFH